MAVETFLPATSTQGGNNYTFVYRSVKLPNNGYVTQIAIMMTNQAGIKVKIVKRNSAGNYDVVLDQAVTAGGGALWYIVTLPTPYTIPATGDYYAAAYFPSGGTMGLIGTQDRSYYSGDATGTGLTFSEDTNDCGAVVAITSALPDFPDVANVAPDDTVGGASGTMDLPALSSVDPAATLRGSAGTLDLPALNKVAPSDTLKGSAGTLDLPALNKVAPSDTLEGAAGTLDLPALGAVLTTDTLEGAAGTWNATNLDTESEFQANVKSGVTGGPAGAWSGEYAGEVGDVPAQPTLELANDSTGTSFTATITGLTSGDYRRLRYRAVGSSTWTTTAASVQGNGTHQITGLTAGGYEAEAFGSNGAGVGPTSTRDYITVDDGTASAYPVDTRQVDNLARLLLETDETAVLYSRNATSAAFSPEYATSEVETYDSVAGLSISAPRRVSERMVEASRGLYTVRDWYVYVSKAELDVYATTPRIMDKLESNSSGVTYDVIAVDVCFNRAGYRLVLREAT
jgi:hypothetical protein